MRPSAQGHTARARLRVVPGGTFGNRHQDEITRDDADFPGPDHDGQRP